MQKSDLDTQFQLETMCDKYEELVWYARKPSIDRVDETYNNLPQEVRDIVKQCIRETEKKYPQEVYELNTCRSNWEHGFNSGCLASFRLILDALDGGIENAMENFPSLDT